MSISHRLSAILCLACLGSGAAWAAKIPPPSSVLAQPTTTIVVADYQAEGPYNRIVFAKVRVLKSHAEVPDLIDIAKPDLREPLVIGKRYLIAYSPYAENQYERTTVNPRGARFISSPGIEPALFVDSAENQDLLMWRIDGDASGESAEKGEGEQRNTRAAMPRMLALLGSADPQHRAFAAAEIAYRPQWVDTLSNSEQGSLQRFVANEAGPEESRAILLAAAIKMPANSGAVRGWDRIVRNLLDISALTGMADAGRSRLLIAALSYPPSLDRHRDGRLHARWLRSDNIALVETAANALQQLSVDLAKRAVAEALAGSDLPPDTRVYLVDFEKRLALMTAKTSLNQ